MPLNPRTLFEILQAPERPIVVPQAHGLGPEATRVLPAPDTMRALWPPWSSDTLESPRPGATNVTVVDTRTSALPTRVPWDLQLEGVWRGNARAAKV